MKNSTYKKDRPQLSENQINSNKNFNATLKNVKPNSNTILKSFKYWGSGGMAVIAILAAIYFFNNETNLQQKTNQDNFTYEPNNELAQLTAIKPPFIEHDIPYEVFKINASKDEVITTNSGTTFLIKKHTLVDSNHNLIEGLAEIHYREFRNPVDIFLSGIPMDFDSAGTSYPFESAGMLDIKGFKNGSPIEIAENKTIDFLFNSTSTENSFDLFTLNKETGVWTKDEQSIPVANYHQPNNEKKTNTAINKPISPIKQNKKKYTLNLDVDKTNYPELATYEGTIFEINESAKKFDPLIYKIQWQDAKLSDSKEKNNYTLKLTREDSSVYLTVYPVVKDAYYEKAISKYQNEMALYNKKTANINDEFDGYDDAKAQTISQEINAAIAINTSEQFSKNSSTPISVSTIAGSIVTRAFRLSSFGIANCDMLIMPQNQPNLLAQLKTVDNRGNKIEITNYNVANPKKNAVQSFVNNNEGLRYHRRGPSVLWFVTANGLIGIAYPEQFKTIKKADEIVFKTYSSQKGIEELRNLMAYK